jgi:thymidine kinase
MNIIIKNMTTSPSSLSLLNSKGYLELIIGPMYSGKTSKLLEIYKQCKFCNISVAVINHSLDKRYHESMLSSHDKIMVPCLNVDNLTNIWYNNGEIDLIEFADKSGYKLIRESEVILINEGQFFNDLHNVVNDMLKNNKVVYVCGLDGDFERKKFGQILDLIPLCDKVNKLTSLCSSCKNGTPGIFSMRITNEKEQTVIGSENYLPVCRMCYDKKYMCFIY